MPKYEFWAMKQAYIAKYGYTINIPSLGDIIELSPINPPTPFEEAVWKAKKYELLSPARVEEIRKYKAKRKQQFLAMLGSPTPQSLLYMGSVATALDDAEDALVTLVVLGKILIKILPEFVGKLLAGPFAWILLASDILNSMRFFGIPFLLSKAKAIAKGKRLIDVLPRSHRVTREGKTLALIHNDALYNVKKIEAAAKNKVRNSTIHFGSVLEVAQVTDQVFGVGLSLGPIVGMAEDAVSGLVRTLMGQKVSAQFSATGQPLPNIPITPTPAHLYTTQPPGTSPAYYPACRVPKAALIYWSSGFKFDDDTNNMMIAANYLAHQEILSAEQPWNILDQNPDVGNLAIAPPQRINWITKEIIEEEGLDWRTMMGWPHSGGAWVTINDIMDNYPSAVKSGLDSMLKTQSDSVKAYFQAAALNETMFHLYANLVGEGNVRYDYTEAGRWFQTIMETGVFPARDTPDIKLRQLVDVLRENEKRGTRYSQEEFISLMLDLGLELEIAQ